MLPHPMNSAEFVAAGYRYQDFYAYFRFMNRIRELGATSASGAVWRGMYKPFPLVCPNGHACNPRPNGVQQGRGICRSCPSKTTIQAEQDFLRRLSELGAEPLYDTWQGADKHHHVRCPVGHDCYPRPHNIQQGQGICRVCAGKDPVQAEQTFLRRLSELGAEPLYNAWHGTMKPHHVRCANGHDSYPYPAGVQQGKGICQQCRVYHNALYVVANLNAVKVGVTSGDHKPRLNVHKHDGFPDTLRLYTNLPDGVARTAEQQAIAACRDAGFIPVRGREYYHIAALPVILDVVDGHAEAAGAVNQVVCWDDVFADAEWSEALCNLRVMHIPPVKLMKVGD